MTHILAPIRFLSRMKAKGKTHVCFPFCFHSAWNGSTGHFIYTDFNTHYIG
jgi:hypothetical protein